MRGFEVNNVTGSLLVENVNVKSDKPKKIIVNGLLLPKDKISRNKVLYDWGSIKDKHNKLIGMSMAYNHRIEEDQLPVGHFTDSVLIESRPDDSSKWLKIWDITTGKNNGVEQPGWYYEADVRPGTELADCIIRGDLSKISIQVMADRAIPEEDDNGDEYKRAFIGSIIEASPVISPGFMETTMEVALAEAFKIKESGQTTANNPGAYAPLLDKEYEEEDEEEDEEGYVPSSNDLNDYANFKYNKKYDDLTDYQQRVIRVMSRKNGPFMESKESLLGVFPINSFIINLTQRVNGLKEADKFNYDKLLLEAKEVINHLESSPELDSGFVEKLLKN